MTRSLLALMLLMPLAAWAAGDPDPERDLLVTIANEGAAHAGAADGVPYRKRKLYAVAPSASSRAASLAARLSLVEVARWPMRSLPVVCIVYRAPPGADRAAIADKLRGDSRVRSAWPLQRYRTLAAAAAGYDDTYLGLQYGLDRLRVPLAHRHTRGHGVRVAIVDGAADVRHEDLAGRVVSMREFRKPRDRRDLEHGTAVASIIGASANNARGIVGIAPEADLAIYAACVSDGDGTVCDSFSLARALDALATDRADVVNLSLTGPFDPLLDRLLDLIAGNGSVIVAAQPSTVADGTGFPANVAGVIAVSSDRPAGPSLVDSAAGADLFAPGDRIVVALPSDSYDFRSGSSLAAAHISGIVALLRSAAPVIAPQAIASLLGESQRPSPGGRHVVDACDALRRLDPALSCE